MTIEGIYLKKCNDNSDICQHLPTLKEYTEKCESVIELGVRSIVSTWAFLMGKPKKMLSVDIKHPSEYLDYDPNGCNIELVEKLAKEQGTEYTFQIADTLNVSLPYADLIFFDTLHTYEQLSKELLLHGVKAKKYMIFHDTVSYCDELLPAIYKYMLYEKGVWEVADSFVNNNGLLILKRK